MKISQRKFDNQKPSKVNNRIVCTYCENVRLKIQAINKFAKKMKHQGQFWKNIVRKMKSEYNKQQCLNRECEDCGTNAVKEEYSDILDERGSEIVHWNKWEKEAIQINDKKAISRTTLNANASTDKEFF